MNFKVGDRVSFLDEAGGGVISKIVNKDIVEVEIEDGFNIQMHIKSIILNASSSEGNKGSLKNVKVEMSEASDDEGFEDEDYSEKLDNDIDIHNGVYLAFVPTDKIAPVKSDKNVYLINYTEFDVMYSYFFRRSTEIIGVDSGVIKSNNKLLLETVPDDEIKDWFDATIQLMFFKEGQTRFKAPIIENLKINSEFFHKEENYKDSCFFVKDKAFMLRMGEIKVKKVITLKNKDHSVDAAIEKLAEEKKDFTENKAFSKKHRQNNPEFDKTVDLHIGALIEDYKEINKNNMLEFQMIHFKKELDNAIVNNLNKITFIHGIGNGVLKTEICNYLKHQTGIVFYDAPSNLYGMGATEVRIL